LLSTTNLTPESDNVYIVFNKKINYILDNRSSNASQYPEGESPSWQSWPVIAHAHTNKRKGDLLL